MCKYHEIDVRVRAELDEKVPRFVADSLPDTLATLEAKLQGSLDAHEAKMASTIEARCKIMEKYVEGFLTAQEVKLTSAAENRHTIAEKFGKRLDGLETAVKTHMRST